MLNLKYIRENPEKIKENCRHRLVDVDIDELLRIDKERRRLLNDIGALRAKRNFASKIKPTAEQIAAMKQAGKKIKEMEIKLKKREEKLNELLFRVPNLTHPKVRISDNENDNPVLDTYGRPTEFDFEPLDHVALAAKLDLIDFNRATKVSGAKFYYLKRELVLMELALIQYALDVTAKYGFIPFSTPDLAKQDILRNLGFNPRGESTQIYNIEKSDLSLIGTAEITLGGYHAEETLAESDLPKKYVAVSHCFRTEAGSYSKFSKGIFRVHQFTKVEMFQYTMPDQSEKAHKEILQIEREIFEGLDIPFRVVDHCTADLGGPSVRTFDLEAWLPAKPNKSGGVGDWAEVTSTSNCTDYQSRGLNIKYKNKKGEKGLLHTLNGTAVAVSRTIIAIMENYQQADGSIVVPTVLRQYMGGIKKICR